MILLERRYNTKERSLQNSLYKRQNKNTLSIEHLFTLKYNCFSWTTIIINIRTIIEISHLQYQVDFTWDQVTTSHLTTPAILSVFSLFL